MFVAGMEGGCSHDERGAMEQLPTAANSKPIAHYRKNTERLSKSADLLFKRPNLFFEGRVLTHVLCNVLKIHNY
jgi:hypothetical protein